METLIGLAHGFEIALQPANLLWAFIGVTLGTAVGVLPGIGPSLTVAMLLPLTLTLGPVPAFIMFAGIYYGAMYGSSTTSILLNTPGESSSIVTAIEGHQMAKRGRGAAALAVAAIGSFVAGTIATFALALFAPIVANLALKLGPADYFMLMVLAFVTVSAVLGRSILLGLGSLFIGLTLGLVGIDIQSGQARMVFDMQELLDGMDVVVLAVGLFALGEVLYMATRPREASVEIIPIQGRLWLTKEELKRSWKPWLRGSLIGFPFGAMPAGGAEIPSFVSYAVEKRLCRYPEQLGKGAIECVAGPEATNNAAVTGVLVPLLTLGIPTSSTAAMMLAGFQQLGLQPGPLLFSHMPDLVWGLIASLYVGNIMLLVLNLPLAGLWVRVLAIPRPYLYAGILVFASVGVLSVNGSVFDLGILCMLGFAGYLMRCADMPLAPAVVGLILGPMAEQHFRRALAISQGDATVFLTRPFGAVMFTIAAIVILAPIALRIYSKYRPAPAFRQGEDL